VALDYRLAVSPATGRLPGVAVALIDGDRALRVGVAPQHTLTVLGLLGEPMLRFDRDGVWISRRSTTAQSDRLVTSGSGWKRATKGHVYTWHDHRLSPPPLAVGAAAPWRFAARLDERRVALTGSFVRVARPTAWPWAVGAAAAALALLAAARRMLARRGVLTTGLAATATLAALVAQTGFVTADELAGTGRWLQVAALAVLAGAAVALLALDRRRRHVWAPMLIGIVAAVICLGSLSVFWHGVVISSLPDWAVRLSTGLAVLAGAGAAAIGALTDDPDDIGLPGGVAR
jgi:hypothetical protein